MSNKKSIEGNAADSEGLKRMNEVSNIDKKEEADSKVVQQASIDAIDRASQKLCSVITRNSDDLVVLRFRDMRYSSAYCRSTLGAARTSDTEFRYYLTAKSDIRDDKRFMDIFEIRVVMDTKSLRLFYPVIINNSADIDNKNSTKSRREYTHIVKDFPFQKLVVTDLISHEMILADIKEMIAVFLITALFERVLDSLNTRFVVYLKENATNFNACDFAGYLNLQTHTDVRWHDLITAMQAQFDVTFADRIIPLKGANIVIAKPEVYWAISRDRIAPGYAYYSSGKVFGADNLELRNIFWDKNMDGLLLTNTQAVRIEVVDEVYVHHRRVVQSASGENLHSLTAEVYYRFIPMKLPLPAIISNGIPDLRALQP